MIFQRVNSYKYYQDFVDMLRNVFKRLTLILDGVPCIKITDPEVKRIFIEKYDKDGNGEINVSESENLNIGICFYQNKKIKTFNEIKKFKGLHTNNSNSFAESTIEEIEFAAGQYLEAVAFANCLNLRHIVLPSDMTKLNWFNNNPALETIDLPDTITHIDANQLSYSGLKEFTLPPRMTKVTAGLCQYCDKLEKVTILSEISSLELNAFKGSANIKSFILYTIIPPTLVWGALSDTNLYMKIYVPDESVDAYKTATGWKSRFEYIYPLSQYKG